MARVSSETEKTVGVSAAFSASPLLPSPLTDEDGLGACKSITVGFCQRQEPFATVAVSAFLTLILIVILILILWAGSSGAACLRRD